MEFLRDNEDNPNKQNTAPTFMPYKITYDREACIGAFACVAAAPDFWEFNEDGKADFRGATFNSATKLWELIIEDKDFADNEAAAHVCPVFAIKIEKME
jgi:ferredoxin